VKTAKKNPSYLYSFLLLLCFGVFLYVFLAVNNGNELSWETPIQSFFLEWNKGVSHSFFVVITEFGSKTVIGIGSLLLLAYLWIFKKNYVAMAIVVLAVAGGDQLNKFIKKMVERERPAIDASIDALGYSFPSGHAMVGIIFYTVIAYFLTQGMKSQSVKALIWVTAYMMVVLVGISRIVLSAHYPSDIIGGYALGGLFVLSCLKAYQELYTFMNKA
jgi:undecaprenyl-diphosphatase